MNGLKLRLGVPVIRQRIIALAAFACLGLSGLGSGPARASDGDSFLCDIDGGGRVAEAFPDAVGIAIGSEAEGSYVLDPIINYYYGEPIKAKVTTDNDARLSVSWVVKVRDKDTGKSQFNLHFELKILKGPMTARLRMQAQGDTYEFQAPGTCVRKKW